MSNQETDKVPDTKAVAITRDSNSSAPSIAAKGQGFLAEKILDIAFAEGVKVRQDKDLVELLDAFDVDCPVPLEALHAVSLILERVYAENSRMEGSSPVGSSGQAGTAVSVDLPIAERMPPKEGE